MLIIDQARIGAPEFPRTQEWWSRFVPVWVRATVRDDGTVALEPSGDTYDYSGPDSSVIVHRELSAAERKRYAKHIVRYFGGFPRLSAEA